MNFAPNKEKTQLAMSKISHDLGTLMRTIGLVLNCGIDIIQCELWEIDA